MCQESLCVECNDWILGLEYYQLVWLKAAQGSELLSWPRYATKVAELSCLIMIAGVIEVIIHI